MANLQPPKRYRLANGNDNWLYLLKLLDQGREIVEEVIALYGDTMELGRYEKLNEWLEKVK